MVRAYVLNIKIEKWAHKLNKFFKELTTLVVWQTEAFLTGFVKCREIRECENI